jgi:hypothetical protein
MPVILTTPEECDVCRFSRGLVALFCTVAFAIVMLSHQLGTTQVLDSRLTGGTLVVMVPTAEGLVIGADSRDTISGKNGYQHFCDDVFKIVEISRFDRTAFVVTGHSTILDLSEAIYLDQVCSQRRAIFDIAAVVKQAFESGRTLPNNVLETLPEICVRAVKEFSSTNNTYASLLGKQLFQIAVGRFEPSDSISIVDSFAVALGEDGEVRPIDSKSQRFKLDQEPSLTLYGEAGYLTQSVFNGPGAQFLTDRYSRFKNGPKRIEDVEVTVGADFATDLIEAAAKTSLIVLPSTGIGGPVDVILLGKDARPKRIKWKD